LVATPGAPGLQSEKETSFAPGDMGVLISKDNQAIRAKILDLDRRIEQMHLGFQKYAQGIDPKRPDLEVIEKELLTFSQRRIFDLELSKQLDRVMFKFQNRKKIWLRWVEEFQKAGPRV
jgi:hypothetical protein